LHYFAAVGRHIDTQPIEFDELNDALAGEARAAAEQGGGEAV